VNSFYKTATVHML